MAIIKEMLGRKLIDGFKGKVDFYYYMGVPCARKWPRSQGNSQTPASVAQWPRFTYATRLPSQFSPFVIAAYKDISRISGLHWRDWALRGYLTGIYKYPEP